MGFDEKEATLKADLDYATLIGIQQLHPSITDNKMQELWALQKKMIGL